MLDRRHPYRSNIKLWGAGGCGRALIVEHVCFDVRVRNFAMQCFLHQPLRPSHRLKPPTVLCFADIIHMECATSHLRICLAAFLRLPRRHAEAPCRQEALGGEQGLL